MRPSGSLSTTVPNGGFFIPNGSRVSVLLRHEDTIYRSYYAGQRGVEHLGSHWTYLDLTPFRRQETWEDSPEGWPQTEPYGWIRRHDDYGSQ